MRNILHTLLKGSSKTHHTKKDDTVYVDTAGLEHSNTQQCDIKPE